MAKTPEKVYSFLGQVWDAALPVAKAEAAAQQELIKKEGGKFKLEPWDWWFYTEKIKKEKYDLDDEVTRPYFKIDNVMEGMFYVANQLYGLTFTRRTDIPKYHPDVNTFEVQREGKHIGILMIDNYPRLSKRGGAWFQSQNVQLHLGVEADFKPARKAHPAFIVNDLDGLIAKVQAAGYETDTSQPPLEGYKRAHVFDPFGNRIELMETL